MAERALIKLPLARWRRRASPPPPCARCRSCRCFRRACLSSGAFRPAAESGGEAGRASQPKRQPGARRLPSHHPPFPRPSSPVCSERGCLGPRLCACHPQPAPALPLLTCFPAPFLRRPPACWPSSTWRRTERPCSTWCVPGHARPVCTLTSCLQVFEYLDTDLKKYMDLTGRGPGNPLSKGVVQNFMYQLLIGIAHLHRHGVMHRYALGREPAFLSSSSHAGVQGSEAAELAGGQSAQHSEDCGPGAGPRLQRSCQELHARGTACPRRDLAWSC